MNCKIELKNFIDHYGWEEFEEALEEIKEEKYNLPE
jgi:dissimilatory sulfite reductase (desulfoviridin) alpha/beta subunit